MYATWSSVTVHGISTYVGTVLISVIVCIVIIIVKHFSNYSIANYTYIYICVGGSKDTTDLQLRTILYQDVSYRTVIQLTLPPGLHNRLELLIRTL